MSIEWYIILITIYLCHIYKYIFAILLLDIYTESMDFSKELAKLGLSKPEIIIYLYLLEQGLSTPPEIIRSTKILRANAYLVLKSLSEKGLIDTQPKGKRKLYYAKSPDTLMQTLENRKNTLADMLPDLRALYKSQKNKPSIKFLYGLEEIKDLFTSTWGKEKVQYILSTNVLFETYPEAFDKYRKELKRKNIFVQDILTQKSAVSISEKTKEAMGIYYDYRLFEQKYEDMPTSIRIWDENIALVSFDEPAFGTVIQNEALAATFRVIFETLWKTSSKN